MMMMMMLMKFRCQLICIEETKKAKILFLTSSVLSTQKQSFWFHEIFQSGKGFHRPERLKMIALKKHGDWQINQ